jgi:putative chitinase
VTGLIKLINADNTIADIRWAAYILATIRFESGGSWRPDAERGTPDSFLARYGPATRLGARLGNKVPDDAYRYRGRGFLFVTGRGNYARYGVLLGMEDQLVQNPDLLLEPAVAYRVTAQGMEKGWFTGRKLSDFITGDAVDYVNARRTVKGLDHALDLSQAAVKLEQILAASLEHAKSAPRR